VWLGHGQDLFSRVQDWVTVTVAEQTLCDINFVKDTSRFMSMSTCKKNDPFK